MNTIKTYNDCSEILHSGINKILWILMIYVIGLVLKKKKLKFLVHGIEIRCIRNEDDRILGNDEIIKESLEVLLWEFIKWDLQELFK